MIEKLIQLMERQRRREESLSQQLTYTAPADTSDALNYMYDEGMRDALEGSWKEIERILCEAGELDDD